LAEKRGIVTRRECISLMPVRCIGKHGKLADFDWTANENLDELKYNVHVCMVIAFSNKRASSRTSRKESQHFP